MGTQNIFNIEEVLLGNGDNDELTGKDTNDLLFGDLRSDTL